MNSKTKTTTNKIVKYLRELSIIVAGVAITLSASLWIGQKSEKKDMKLYLKSIRIELEENMKEFDKVMAYHSLEANYTMYLLSHDIESRHIDSLAYYANICCQSLQTFSFKTNAFEMLKSSGVLRLLDDKELVLALWNTYDELSELKRILEWHFQLKWAAVEKELPRMIDLNFKPEDMVKTPVMYLFYRTGMSVSIRQNCEENLNTLKETVEKLVDY